MLNGSRGPCQRETSCVLYSVFLYSVFSILWAYNISGNQSVQLELAIFATLAVLYGTWQA